MVDAGLQPAAVDCDFAKPPTIKASKHLFCLTSVPLLYRGWVYFFSTRRKLVILQANKPEITGVLTSLAAVSPRHIRICRRTITSVLLHIHYTYAVRTEKTPPTPVRYSSNLRISNFRCFLSSLHPSFRASVPRFLFCVTRFV